MKRKFILLAMMLLTLIGGVKFNVLNAQETIVKIGGEPSSNKTDNALPIYSYYCHSMSQQIYLATEMIDDDGNRVDGNITSLSLYNVSGTQVNTRKIDVYMAHIAESSLTTGQSMTSDNLVFSGEYTFNSSTELTTIEFTSPFEYNGQDNIILTIVDNTGTARGSANLSNMFYVYNSLVDNNKRTAYHRLDRVGYNITDLKHTDGSTFSLNLGQNSNLIQFTIESAAPAVMPSSVPEITSIEATHNSVTLSWNAVENAKKYNVYTSTGDLVNTVSSTSCTIEGLDDLTEYCYQVSAVNGEFETAKSTARCVTTLEAPKTQKIVFTLNDTYGDGWVANNYSTSYHTLTIKVNGEELKNLTINNGKTYTETLEINEGASVAVIFNNGGSWSNECSYKIEYEDGEVITSELSGLYGGHTYNFVVRTSDPKVTVAASVYDIYSDQTATLTATAANFDGDVAYSWSLNGEIVGTDATYTFDPSAAGIYTFTCTAIDANNNEASASVTINVTERPALALDVTADKTEIYQGQNTMLYASAIGGFPAYSFNWLLNGEEYGTGSSFYFDQTEVGEYTITCKVTDDNGGTIEKSVTVNVLENKLYGKQFRIKALSYNTKDANNIYAGPNPFQNDMYLHITSHSSTDEALVWVLPYEETPNQKFTFELTNTDNVYYLRSADGYYLHCYNWHVVAYSTYQYTASPIGISYIDDTEFYLMNGSKYFKAEYGDGGNYKVYCDFDQQAMTATWVLEEVLPVIENLMASDTQLYPGETTTLTWGTFEGAASYNVYVNSELNGSTTGTSYELSGLAYNMNPGHKIEVVALNENGDVISGKASVIVQVAGTFTLTVNVTDGTNNPIEGATVNVTTDEWTYDEFGYNIASLSSLLTDENGQAVFNNVKLLNPDTYCAYSISATMDVYGTHSTTPLANYESVANGGNVTRTIVMTLPEPKNITADKELYIAGEDVVLTWETPEFNTRAFLGYNVYSGDYDLGTETSYTKLNEETLTETTYTIKNVEYGAKFAVSAVYDEGESSKVNANVQITTYANLVVNVKDANTSAGIDGAVVEIYSYRTGETETFVTANGGIVEEEYLLGNYTVTVKKNDSHYEVEPQEAQLVYGDGAELEFELTPKASIENVTVTADNNGNVSWDGDYAKWNVYRRNTNAPQELTSVATEVITKSTTDAAWETLEPGTYQYGVAALVEPQAQTRGTEVIFEEGFENGLPTGWTREKYSQSGGTIFDWYVTTGHNGIPSQEGQYIHTYSNTYSGYSILKTIEYAIPNNAALEFDYYSKPWGTDLDYIEVYAVDEYNTQFLLYTTNVYSSWETVECSLSQFAGQNIKVWFKCIFHYAYGVAVDNFKITGEVTSETETQIVWSNDVVKQAPATFIGGDTENPTAWNVDANWSTGSVPADGAEVTINANAVITGAVNVSNLTINQGDSYPYNKLTVANGGALTVTGTISQASNYLLVLEEGGQIFQNNANVTARFSMSIDNPTDWSTSNKDGWQFISMPLENVSHEDFTSYGEYDLYKYDGSQDLEWQNHKDGGFDYGGVPETTFRLGHGYLASLKDTETATVYGTLNVSTPTVFGGYTQIIYNEEKDLANFRLFGNPFTYDIYMSDFDLDFYNDGENDFVSGYAVIDKYGSYVYRTTEPIKVGEGFFVKALTTTAIAYAPTSKRSENKSNNSLNITATGNAGKDNVIINFAGKSEGFDKLQNFNDAIATVYVAEDGKNYGIYNCDADVQEVELSFNANKMGNYTISIEPNGKFETVTLVDRFTGVETNMLVEDYNFTAMSEENPNRFIVRMVNGQQTTDNSHFVYQSGEELILNIQGEVQIVDVLGRVVYNGEAMNDINRINVSSFNSGAYMVKVMNGNEVKVEKVVIY